MFFALRPRRAVLADLNEHLIRCYEAVRDRPDLVGLNLRRHAGSHSRPYYYGVRNTYNRSGFGPPHAARFIYLNQTCFNGVFRVNKQGEFNVPFGDKPHPAFPTTQALKDAADALSGATLLVADYGQTCSRAEKGDFIYLDPPYPPLNGTSFFTHYTPDRFGEADQRKLAEVFGKLDARGCAVMMSNADTPLVRSLYRGFRFYPLTVTRFVTCKAVRHQVRELIITNYPVAAR
jgi:DNA adenine methylase